MNISTFFEWVFRLGIVGVSVLQFLMINSDNGQYCSKVKGLLALESEWLTSLIKIQMIRVVVISVWKILLISHDEQPRYKYDDGY